MQRAFDKLDVDSDGYICLDELLDLLTTFASLASTSTVKTGGAEGLAAYEAERRAEAKLMLREADMNGWVGAVWKCDGFWSV